MNLSRSATTAVVSMKPNKSIASSGAIVSSRPDAHLASIASSTLAAALVSIFANSSIVASRLRAVSRLATLRGSRDSNSRAARLGSFPHGAYAHTKAALVADAIARIEAEKPEEAIAGAAIWMTPESVAARAAQAQKLAGG